MYVSGQVPSSIGDRVWYDTDNNGVQDGGELGIPGVVVKLYDTSGSSTPIATTRTDVDGLYTFDGLKAGSYIVEFVAPVGYVISPPDLGGNDAADSDANPTTGRTATIVLPAGQTNVSVDAGMRIPGAAAISIGDLVWLDGNGNFLPNLGEGLAGAEVVLYDALGNELARITTNATDTNYTFTGVGPGSYRVAVDTSTLPSVVQIADPDSILDNQTELLGQAVNIRTVDFGYRLAVPDLTPVITLEPNVMIGPTSFEVWVQCIELLGVDTSGTIRLRVPKDSRWTMNNWAAEQNLTQLPVSGKPVDNSIWTMTQDANAFYFTTNATILGQTQKNFGFSASWSSGFTVGGYTASVLIELGSGGEVRIDNNTDAERADYSFQ
jgi:hypothetical protein